jgi:hypothetical protein
VAQDLIFWVATAFVCMGMGVLFVVFVALKQLTEDDVPDSGRSVASTAKPTTGVRSKP